jgi:hypothetical protein
MDLMGAINRWFVYDKANPASAIGRPVYGNNRLVP